ncbi:MAG: DNA mismatch repair protein MutS [Bacteroidota bacterium]|nr:DNA mismatch repair protein MutS [Bacteroidota bacterium]
MAKKSGKKKTPMMRQYEDIKTKHPEAILLFRVGDFYETFGSDAEKASKTLDIILTKRSNGSASEVALAGFPHHALQTYLPKLVKAGHRVAIVEQLEDPKSVKGLVKRGVTDMVTPGINLNPELLSGKEHNYLASLYPAKKGSWGLAIIEISTGSFYYAEHGHNELLTALSSYKPKEIIHPRDMDRELRKKLEESYYLFSIDSWAWEKDYTYQQLTSHFKTNSLSGFGLQKGCPGAVAAGAVLHHLKRSEYHSLDHISGISRISLDNFMCLDGFTVQNLELFKSNSLGGTSTLDVIDKTASPMGGRLLRSYLALPILDIGLITKRHNAVEALLGLPDFLESLIEVLQGMPDIERLCSRLATGRINPKEMARLREGLKQSAVMVGLVKEQSWAHPDEYPDVLENLCLDLEHALVYEPSAIIGKGESIRSEYYDELARLRALLNDTTGTLESIRDREAYDTGIPSLKLAFNNVFGYYLEVRNSHKDKVPKEWHRKQTLVNAERYITDELKKFEAEVLGAEEQIKSIELKVFADLVEKAKNYLNLLSKLAGWVAATDVLASFAMVAKTHNYCKPTFVDEVRIQIKKGRHPVIEQMLPEEQPYIANGIAMDSVDASIAMITGPNMSGKSALLRQVAIIQVLAQMGSFVPAESANLPIIDRLFVRVGATDNLSKGESTFMVEMNETATILNNISDRSLVILDEIGRGTSTFDGVSIAWGIAEFLHQHPASPIVLFATHYHELNEMANSFKKIKNYHVAAEEYGGEIVFTRQLKKGGTAHSFGLHVAKIAGIPGYVLNRAELVLKELEESKGKSRNLMDLPESGQLNFFSLDRPELEDIADEIKNVNVDQLKPIEALMLLHTFKEKLSKK